MDTRFLKVDINYPSLAFFPLGVKMTLPYGFINLPIFF